MPIPLDDETWESIIRKYRKDLKTDKIVGNFTIDGDTCQRILYLNMSSERILNAVWFRKPETIEIYINEEIIKIEMPYLVFHVQNRIFNVYISKEHPEKETKLYINPFGNLMGGYICTGSIPLPDTYIIPDFLNGWEDVFLRSKFTSLLNAHYNATKGFEDSIRNKGKIPMNNLKTSKKTVKSLFR